MDYIGTNANIFTCIGIFIAALEFHHTRKSTLVENERLQKQATLDFFMAQKPELYSYNHIIYAKYGRDTISYQDIVFDKEFNEVVKNYLNILEIFAAGINTGIYNIDVFDRLYGDACVRVVTQLKYYIINTRKKLQEEEVFLDLENLVEKLGKIQIPRKEILNKNADLKNKF